jgi:thioredoxin reductase (NADPH)
MHDLIIIGAGPAGLSAALYAGRFRLKTLLFEKLSCGGQIILSPEIENYPGFPGGISTYELVEKFKKQVQDLGLTVENEEVLGIEKGQSPHIAVKTATGTVPCRTLIIATGARPKRLGVKGEDRLIGRGVSYCATCDGPLFRDKDIVLVGGGDRAIEEAIFLSGYARKIYLVHRRQELRASSILAEKLKRIPHIEPVFENTLEEIFGQDKVEGVKVKGVKSNQEKKIACQGVFIFVGIEPNTEWVKNILETDAAGFIMTDERMSTSSAGIFAAGDCRKKSLYQVITACADGAVAADSAHKYLLNL